MAVSTTKTQQITGDFNEEFLNPHTEKIDSFIAEKGISIDKGLASENVRERQAKYGINDFDKPKKQGLIAQIFAQLKDVSAIILLVATALSLALALREGHGFVEPAVIFAVIVMNVILAVTQERSAENALEALSSLSSPKCRVLRDGVIKEIDSKQIVPGDVIFLKPGDMIPADGRLVKAERLTIDEASLTGESEPSEKNPSAVLSKDAPLGDRINMIFSGCLVAAGNGVAIVTATGMDTQMGKIAGFLTEKKKYRTPLQVRLDKVGKAVSGLAVASAVVMLTVGLLQGHGFWEMALAAVTLAVAAVPETLSLIVTLILTHGVKKMAAKNALIRKIQAVETLGSTSIICSDKTGTLTMNKMTVKRLWVMGSEPVADTDSFDEKYNDFILKMTLASNASMGVDDNGEPRIMGDPTETAILSLFGAKGYLRSEVDRQYEKVGEIPFSSSRKMMTNIVKDPNGGYIVLTKGAYDKIPFDRSDNNFLAQLEAVHNSFAMDALRVITLATKHIDALPDDGKYESLEKDLEFVGFAGIIDPPREEAAEAIKKAKQAGIRTIMITGDHAGTAAAIARELGIIAANEGVITGQELAKLSDNELNESIAFYSVYARMSPEDKIRIVKAWQYSGEVVAMTGDGVNDAPALKAADVGVAMGINGTEVSKSTANMILMDDKFSTIVEAVTEGRNVFSNIRKLVYFLLVCNISEIIVMLFAQFLGWALPLTPMMLLLINVIGDGIPGMALAKEESDKRIMARKPIEREESFFGGGLMEVILRQTFVFAAVSLSAYYIGLHITLDGIAPSLEIARTMTFLVTGWTSILHVFTVRSRSSIFKYRIKDNPQLYISIAVMLTVFTLITAVPFLATIFGFAGMGLKHWLIAIGLTLVPTLIAEYGKFWDNLKYKSLEKNRVKNK